MLWRTRADSSTCGGLQQGFVGCPFPRLPDTSLTVTTHPTPCLCPAGKLLAGSTSDKTRAALDGYLARLTRLGNDDKHVPSRLRFLVSCVAVCCWVLSLLGVCVGGGAGAGSLGVPWCGVMSLPHQQSEAHQIHH